MRLCRHVTKCRAGQICGVDQNDDNLRIYRTYLWIVITVGLRLGLGLGFSLGLELWFGLGIGLRIVVYKLLEKVTKCGSVT